jgi:predicted dehydrogenase
MDRRDFLRTSAAAGAALAAGGHLMGDEKPKPPSEKLNIAMIGSGGKGRANIAGVRGENIVALCDVDETRAAESFNAFPTVPKFADMRKMFDEMHKQIDAVVVSTPDHMHAYAALLAMAHGKHVYVEKPLTHDIYEARMLREVAARKKLATQMGNQGTAADGLREAVEVIRSGAIGPVREVHVWTNRPDLYWKQGFPAKPAAQDPPKTLNWELWLGTAPEQGYSRAYVPHDWRGWWDFGTGALGDMACHTANMAYMALKLGAPRTVSAEQEGGSAVSGPRASTITFEFPERGEGMPACKVVWYDGFKGEGAARTKNLPPESVLSKLQLPAGKKVVDSGSLFIGDKGMLYSPSDYGSSYVLLPAEQYRDYKKPAPTLPRSPGHYAEWIRACKGGEAAMSNFDYAGPFTEFVLLGVVALRTGKKITWDPEKLECPGTPEASAFIKREYRKGWDLPKA